MENHKIWIWGALVVFLTIISCILGDDVNMDKDMAMSMLKKYNYMGPGHPDSAMSNDSMYSEALMMFQMFAGLNETGTLDEPTMEKMMSPRCGLPDITDMGDLMRRRRRKRYVLHGGRWVDGKVSYHYDSSLPSKGGLGEKTVHDTIDEAFTTWAKVTNLYFTKLKKDSDIKISFEHGDHGDGYALDGPGGTLAHAFYPTPGPIAGDMHFDDAETWTVNDPTNKGTDLYFVALHELGHSLGLQHSMIENAIMYPYYPGYKEDLSLTADDIKGITAIYGLKQTAFTQRPTQSPTDNTPSYRKQFCTTGTVDAIGTLDGMLFAFQGELYAELDEHGIRPGFPRLAADDWEDIPSSPDAALAWEKQGILLIFKGEYYWRYSMGQDKMPKLANHYPRLIREDFTGGLPPRIDAAFQWSKNGHTYIISNQEYYRVKHNYRVSSTKISAKCDRWYYNYPKSFSKEWNIPDGVNDAATFHGRTFFFNDQQYYRYNDHKYRPDGLYPKSISMSWFGCQPSEPLESLEMEMDMMKKQSQFEEIPSRFTASAGCIIKCTVRTYLHLALLFVVVFCSK